MKVRRNKTLMYIMVILPVGACISDANIVVDSFVTEQAEQVISGANAASGNFGTVSGLGILGGTRELGRRQFDQQDVGDLTTVSILRDKLNIEITDTAPSSSLESSILITYGTTTPLDLNLESYKGAGAFRFEFSAVPVGSMLKIVMSDSDSQFFLFDYVLDDLVEEIPITSFSDGLGFVTESTDLSDIDFISIRLGTDDTGYTSIALASLSIVPEPAAALYCGLLCAIVASARSFRRRRRDSSAGGLSGRF